METEDLVANYNGEVINLSDGCRFFEIKKDNIFDLYCYLEDILDEIRENERNN